MKATRSIQTTRQGILDAFNRLVLKYQDPIFQYVIRMLGDPEAAEEVTQATFLQAYREFRSLQDGDYLFWLLRIASRLCLEDLRQRESHPFPLKKRQMVVSMTAPNLRERIERYSWKGMPVRRIRKCSFAKV